MAEAKSKFVFPKSLAACADLIHEVHTRRAEAQRVADAIEEEEKALRAHIIKMMPKDSTGISGKLARVTLVQNTVVRVDDWPTLYRFIGETGSYDLLQRRVSDKAVKDRWELQKVVPGVSPFSVTNLSINQLKG